MNKSESKMTSIISTFYKYSESKIGLSFKKNIFKEIIFLLIIPILLFGCKQKKEVIVDEAIPVEVLVASDESFFNEYTCFGKVDAQSSIKLSFIGGGNLTSVNVKAGEKVNSGQVIATVDNTNALNTYNAAMATYNRALDAYNRAKKVYDNGSMSDLDWMEIKTALDQAESMAKIAEKKLNDCILRSPTSGTILQRFVNPGINVLPSQPIVEIANTKNLVVSFSIPEKEISKVYIGQRAKVTINALDSLTLYGSIIEKNIAPEELSQNYKAKIAFDNDNNVEGLYLGMNCKISLDNDIANSGLIIPFRAIQMDNESKRFVWIAVEDKDDSDNSFNNTKDKDVKDKDIRNNNVKDKDIRNNNSNDKDINMEIGKNEETLQNRDIENLNNEDVNKENINYIAKRAYIKIGDLTDNGVIVIDGITKDTKVITSGYLKLHDGAKVSINNY